MAAEKFPVALKRMLFPLSPHVDRMQLTKASIYSVSPPDQAKIVADVIDSFFKGKVAVTDATSNVGGNLFALMKYSHVNAVEIDAETFEMLKSNVSLLYPENNVVFIHDDYNNVKNVLKQNVIFMDPPWGGVDYYKAADKELYMGDVPLTKLLSDDLRYSAALIIVKVPTTYPSKKLFAMKKYMFQKKIEVARPGKVIYHILVLANQMPMKRLPARVMVKRLNYRQFLQ